MTNKSIIIILSIICALLLNCYSNTTVEQGTYSFVSIQNDLSKDPEVRENAILQLDEILKDDNSRNSTDLVNYYQSMLNQVESELNEEVLSGIRIWALYNHGFIIKTPEIIFAIDLIKGFASHHHHNTAWSDLIFPKGIIDKIDVLFITHNHFDHWDQEIKDSIMDNSGYVVVPAEDSDLGNTPVSGGESIKIMGLQINVYDGLHSCPVRMYEISTEQGIKIFHTGDNQTSETLPDIKNVDVLLLNAWVNESGMESAVTGIRNCINVIKPVVMIPGHIQELGHDYDPGNLGSRIL